MMLPEDTSNASNSNESLGSSCDISRLVAPGPNSDPAGIIISPLTVQTQPPRPASAPINNGTTAKRQCEEDHFFNKRGSGKKTSMALLEGAVKAMEKIASQPVPPPNSEVDAPDAFSSFIAARLRVIKAEETRKQCENEILAVLTKY